MNSFEDVRLFVQAIQRDQHGDRLAENFFSSVTKDALGAFVPASNHAVEVFADDGVIGRFDDGRQAADGFVSLFRRILFGGKTEAPAKFEFGYLFCQFGFHPQSNFRALDENATRKPEMEGAWIWGSPQ